MASSLLSSLAGGSSSKWWLLQSFFGPNHFRNIYGAVNVKRDKNHWEDGSMSSQLGWWLRMGEIYILLVEIFDGERFTDLEMRQRQILRQVKQAKILCSKFLCQVYHQSLWSETQIYITLDTRQLMSPVFKHRKTRKYFYISIFFIFYFSEVTFESKGTSL